MCGIAGVLTFDDSGPGARDAVEAMVGALDHRGPDGHGQWDALLPGGGTVALGHTRLAIIDLTDGGRQPMERGASVVTFNGEIYNHRELRRELEAGGAAFRTDSDTEVLLAAFERWGDAALERLNGMFAFGLWNRSAGRLLLARDRFGIKPLYYHHGPRHLVFASEVRALLASGFVRPALDRASFWHYLGYQTAPTPDTLLKGVRLLEPGHFLEVTADGRARARRYWSLLDAGPSDDVAAPVARARVGELLQAAVAAHMVSDVPVGVFLSGGVDSGSIVSVLDSLGCRALTFTIGLEDDAQADESAEARLVAATFGTEHTEIRLRGSDVLEWLPAASAAVDHPSGDGVNTFVVARAVRDRGLKVALSGLGGDELFGGYPSFRRLSRLSPAARRWGAAPAAMRRAAAGLVRAAGGGRVATEKAAAALESDGSLAQLWPVTRQLFPARQRASLVGDRDAASAGQPDAYASLLASSFAEAANAGLWARISHAETRGYMHDVLLRDADQMSMAHGLEVRVPLLDHRLASYVVSLPDAVKAEGRAAKPLLVAALPRPLPAGLAERAKRGFSLPWDAWMRGPLRAYCEAHLGEQGLDGRGLLQPGAASRLWSGFLQGSRGVTWSRVWALVALNAWLDRQAVDTR